MALHMNSLRLSAILYLLNIFQLHVKCVGSKQVPLQDVEYTCTHPAYNIHLFSSSPVVIYISNFITPSERSHLLSTT